MLRGYSELRVPADGAQGTKGYLGFSLTKT